MKIIQHPHSLLNLNDYGITIPMLDQRVKKVIEHLKNNNIKVTIPLSWPKIEKEIISLAHDKNFCDLVFNKCDNRKKEIIYNTYELIDNKGNYHRYDPKQSKKSIIELIEKNKNHVAGTIKAVEIALKEKFCFFLGGGFHHSMSFSSRGFCMYNDLIIAARWAKKNKGCKSIWIIDVDAHKGDGTAELANGDESIVTLSIHMAKGWPLDEENTGQPWFIPSDIEIPIESFEQEQYLEKLEAGLNKLHNNYPIPDLAIIVQGADPCELDQLPSADLLKLALSTMLERDKLVYNFLKNLNIPQAYVISGGYGDQVYKVYCQFLEWLHISNE